MIWIVLCRAHNLWPNNKSRGEHSKVHRTRKHPLNKILWHRNCAFLPHCFTFLLLRSPILFIKFHIWCVFWWWYYTCRHITPLHYNTIILHALRYSISKATISGSFHCGVERLQKNIIIKHHKSFKYALDSSFLLSASLCTCAVFDINSLAEHYVFMGGLAEGKMFLSWFFIASHFIFNNLAMQTQPN